MSDHDIIDQIDQLVDEQLANYHNRSGYDHNVNQDTCPHCGRHWHGLPVTQRVANMYRSGRYDPAYVAAEDDSPIMCDGSNFIGPIRPGGQTAQFATALADNLTSFIERTLASLTLAAEDILDAPVLTPGIVDGAPYLVDPGWGNANPHYEAIIGPPESRRGFGLASVEIDGQIYTDYISAIRTIGAPTPIDRLVSFLEENDRIVTELLGAADKPPRKPLWRQRRLQLAATWTAAFIANTWAATTFDSPVWPINTAAMVISAIMAVGNLAREDQ